MEVKGTVKNIILILLILIIILIFVGVGIFFWKNKLQKKPSQNKENLQKYSFEFCKFNIDYNNMESQNLIYYKILSSYEDYKNSNNLYSLNLKENDFENNFFIVLAIENTSMLRLTLSEVYKENDTLYIGLDKVTNDKEFDQDNNEIIITLDNSLKTSKIEVFKTIENRKYFSTDKYQDIKTLPRDYSKEQAILDKCVINYNEENAELINQFLEDVNNGIESQVRFYNLEPVLNMITVEDLKYLPDKKIFIFCVDNTRNDQSETYNYYEYDTITKTPDRHSFANPPIDFTLYELTNSNKDEVAFSFSVY